MSVGGLDIGTTGCKITIYDNEGRYQYRSYREYPIVRSMQKQEIDAEYIWKSVKEVIADAAARFIDIESIGVTSFGETFVLLDDKDCPVRPAMLYTDPRGSEECRELTAKLGTEKIETITGLKPHCCYSIAKLMWVKAHDPEDYKSAKHILLMEDYIIYKLTGNAQIDYSLASRTMAFDIRKLDWSDEVFDAAGVEKEMFSKPVISGTVAGRIKKTIAEELGLKSEPIVVPVGHDQVAAAIGAGVFSDSMAVDGAGTVECVTPVFESIPNNRVLYQGSYAVVPYVIPGKYVTYAYSFTGGGLIQWYIRNLAKEEAKAAKKQGISVYDAMERKMKDEPTGILVLPHFAGAATPYMDENSKGAITGLTLNHTCSDLYRAMMEGVAYEMRLNIEKLESAGIKIHTLRATGGGASSKVWMQMKADILNTPIVSLDSQEAGAAGCVMIAGIAAGIFSDLKSSAKLLVHEKESYDPRPQQHEAYMKYYDKYRDVYAAVRPLV